LTHQHPNRLMISLMCSVLLHSLTCEQTAWADKNSADGNSKVEKTTATSPALQKSERRVLYNGIELPSAWLFQQTGRWRDCPMSVAYLESPPQVIPIDVGRQLLVDDFLIEETTLTRKFHRPDYHPANPVLRPDRPWEIGSRTRSAMVYSDGVWYDSIDGMMKMWYRDGKGSTCLAVSTDGIRWEKPLRDVVPGTNVINKAPRDASTVWLDHGARDPNERYKMFRAFWQTQKGFNIRMHTSSDGIHWSKETMKSGLSWDRTSVFYNPFRQVWVYSIRGHDKTRGKTHRVRLYHEGDTLREAAAWDLSSDAIASGRWSIGEPVVWVGADRLDPHHPDLRFSHIVPQLYNLDVFAYESLMIGLFTIWQGPDNEMCKKLGIHKRNEVFVGYTRDGFHWYRPDRKPFLPVSDRPDAWNGGNVQSTGGGLVVVGDRLHFYCSGRTKVKGQNVNSTGLATMRRDGFASMDTQGRPGQLTTRPIRFQGSRLFVNAHPGQGELRVEVLNELNEVIEPFSQKNAIPVETDSTRAELRWKGHANLKTLAGKTVRFRFHLTDGSLYSFWVSADDRGASNGHMAAGGPGFPQSRDTLGNGQGSKGRRD